MKPLVSVKGLRTWFPVKGGVLKRVVGHLKAVDDVSLEVGEGEIVSVVGESGCGKSTLGNTILGLAKAAAGSIRLGNTDLDIGRPASWNPVRKDFQVIFQDPYSSLNPRHTVYEIISEPVLVHGICGRGEIKNYVAGVLEKVGLSPEYMDRFPHAFSGGQRQRIGIARAVALKPRLIICDEIVSALDVSVQAQIIQLMLDLKKELDLSLLFIAHDLSLVRAISDRIYVMYLGRMAECAGNETLFTAPAHPYTKSLMDSVPTLDRSRRPRPLEGEVPSLSKLPPGCAFYARCSNRQTKCRESVPELMPAGASMAACWYPLEPPHA